MFFLLVNSLKIGHFLFVYFLIFFQTFSGRFDTSGSMVPRLVPEISSLDAFCDGAAGAGAGAGGAGIGDSRSWIAQLK